MTMKAFVLFCGLTVFYITQGISSAFADYRTEHYQLETTILTEGLEHPWSLAILPDGNMLATEKVGKLRLIDKTGKISSPIKGLPQVSVNGQGGLLDVILHPQYEKTPWIYFSYAAKNSRGEGTHVARAKLATNKKKLTDVEVIFSMTPKSSGGRHFGSRMAFDDQGYLYITVGDRGERPAAQALDDHRGKIIRLHDDGSIPQDNPFINTPGALPEIYSYGHRNPQGLTFNKEDGQLWEHEHGPQGGDEVNIIGKGKNYGWPVITYGVNYGFGTKIGEGTHKQGMLQPIHYWVPKSIAPSGMSFYYGDEFPQWQGNLFIGALKNQMLVRLEIKNNIVVHEEHLLKKAFGRIRDVRAGKDGYLYLLTDDDDGKLIRLSNKTK